jgi:hypothetical protein
LREWFFKGKKLIYVADKPRWDINIFDEEEEQKASNKIII